MPKDELALLRALAGGPEPLRPAVTAACGRVKSAWTRLLFSPPAGLSLRNYTRFQQQSLLELADELYERAPGSFLLEQLAGLYHFQVRYFNAYINPGLAVPRAAAGPLRQQMRAAAEQLAGGADSSLEAVIQHYLQSATQPGTVLTYHAWAYFNRFTAALKRGGDVYDNLLYLNFNHPAFIRWCRENARPVTCPILQTTRYDPGLLPLDVLLAGLKTTAPAKLHLRLTVAQLALLLRLLQEEGAFALTNIAGLLRFFSAHFTSKRQEQISYGSMNKLYYSGDQFTGAAVRELLLKMVARINHMFFPA